MKRKLSVLDVNTAKSTKKVNKMDKCAESFADDHCTKITFKVRLRRRLDKIFITKFTLMDDNYFFNIPPTMQQSIEDHPELKTSLDQINMQTGRQKTIKIDLNVSNFVKFVQRVVENYAHAIVRHSMKTKSIATPTSLCKDDHQEYRVITIYVPKSTDGTDGQAEFSLQPSCQTFPISKQALDENVQMQSDLKLSSFLCEITKSNTFICARLVDVAPLLSIWDQSSFNDAGPNFSPPPIIPELFQNDDLKICGSRSFRLNLFDPLNQDNDAIQFGFRLMKFFIVKRNNHFFLSFFALDPNDRWIKVPINQSLLCLYPEVANHAQIKRRLQRIKHTATFVVWADCTRLANLCKRTRPAQYKQFCIIHRAFAEDLQVSADCDMPNLLHGLSNDSTGRITFAVRYAFLRVWVTRIRLESNKIWIPIPSHLQEINMHPELKKNPQLKSIQKLLTKQKLSMKISNMDRYVKMCSLIDSKTDRFGGKENQSVPKTSIHPQPCVQAKSLKDLLFELQKLLHLLNDDISISPICDIIPLLNQIRHC